MPSFLDSFPAAAEAGGTAKRAKGGGKGGGKGDGNGNVAKGLRTALTAIRKLESELEYCFIFAADSEVTTLLTRAQETHTAQRPQQGGPHPLGPPRHILLMGILEAALNRYDSNKVLLEAAIEAVPEAKSKLTALRLFVNAIGKSDGPPMELLRHLISFGTFKLTKEKMGLLRLTPLRGRIMEPRFRSYSLFGGQCEEIFDLTFFAFAEERQWGPAPPGTLERVFSKSFKKDKDDDDMAAR